MPLFKKSHPSKKTKQKTNKQEKQRQQQFLTAQDSIFYESMMQDGMCNLGDDMYSRTYRFDDINYRLNRMDDQKVTFSKFCEMYNYLDPETTLQILLINHTGAESDFTSQMFYPMRGDTDDVFRKEINAVTAQRGLEGSNNIIRDRFVTIGTHAEDASLVRQKLSRVETGIAEQFKAMGSNLHLLTGEERLEVMSNLLRPNEPFDFTYDDLVVSGRITKDFICPSSFDFKPVRTFHFGDQIGQVLYASKLPNTLSDEVLCDISDLPINLAISFHVQAEDQNDALEYVRKQIAFMDQEASDKQSAATMKGYAATLSLSQEFQYNYEKSTQLLSNMQHHDQHLFRTTLMVFAYADTEEELKKNTAQIIAVARQKGVEFSTLDYEQEYGLNSVLPLGRNFVLPRRTLTTAAASIFMPFMAVELLEPGGIIYGINSRSNALIAFDRTALRASNAVILGTPGSGKGMFSKQELCNVFLNRWEDEIIVVDPEGEYAPLAEVFHDNAEIIRIHGGSDAHLNPLDISENYGDDDDPMAKKLDFMCSFIELLSSSSKTVSGLDGKAVSIIDRSLHETYRNYLANPETAEMPTLVDFYNVLTRQPEPEARAIALQLEAYITGSLNVFSKRTNVSTSKRLVIYDIKKLGKHLRTVGMLTVLDQIWNRITVNRDRGVRTWIYIDEIQLLFSNPYCSDYFFELWSRARKWGAVPTGITQNVETLLLSNKARSMLSNSDMVVMLNQSRNDSPHLAELLKISPQQLSYVDNALPGHGLMYVQGRVVPFDSTFPKHTKLYSAMTTKLEEVVAQRQLQQVYSNEGLRTSIQRELGDIIDETAEQPAEEQKLHRLTIRTFGCRFQTVTEDGTPKFTETGLADAEFIVRSEDTDQSWNVCTGNDGIFVLHLAAGQYSITAKAVPDGYLFRPEDSSHQLEIQDETEATYHLHPKSTKIMVMTETEGNQAFGLSRNRFVQIGLYTAETITAADGTQLPANSLVGCAKQVPDLQSCYIIQTMLTGEFYLAPVDQKETIQIPVSLHPAAYDEPLDLPEPIPVPLECVELSGVKVDEDGEPLDHVCVGLFPSDCTAFHRENAVVTTCSNSDGEYTFAIPACLSKQKWKTRIVS